MPVHPTEKRNYEYWIIGIIILVAFVFRFQNIQSIPSGLHPHELATYNQSLESKDNGEYKVYYDNSNIREEGMYINLGSVAINIFGENEWTLRLLSAITGLLTVIGLYKLTKILTDWKIAGLSSFLFAISFWHVVFSRLGLRAILAPLFITWALYYLWKAKKTHSLWHFGISGFVFGLGILSYSAFPILFIVLILVLTSYWSATEKDFNHNKYLETKSNIIRGFAVLLLLIAIVSAPLLIFYSGHSYVLSEKFTDVPGGIIGAGENSITKVFQSTFEMFVSTGDKNLLHGLPGSPILYWPVGLLFLIGLLRSFVKLFKLYKKHGHFSTVQVLLLSWFFIGLIPSMWGGDVPNSMLALIVSPVVFIFAGEGLWWIYESIIKYHKARDPHEVDIHGHHMTEGKFLATIMIVVFLLALTLQSYQTYFVKWAYHPNIDKVFTKTLDK